MKRVAAGPGVGHGLSLGVAVGLTMTAVLGSCDPADVTSAGPPPVSEAGVALLQVASGLESPVDFQTPLGDERSFIVEQPGRIRILEEGGLVGAPFLDVTDRVGFGGERGLLGLAFPPDFASSRRFFVHYSDLAGRTTISRFGLTSDPDVADPTSEEIYLTVPQPFGNHNGGQISFGPDGMLYVALGDGGSAGDPLGSGQDAGTLLGSLLRLDVRADPPYRIPNGNPFVGDPAGRDEIWAIGLRNPWKFSWDNGFIFIADVGQNRWEEINTAPETIPGRNYGWNRLEGGECFQGSCDIGDTTLPTLAYAHPDGCSVSGGYVYRGSAVPALEGLYVYGDYCGGWIRAFRLVGRDVEDEQTLGLPLVENLTSFGLDSEGELYVLSQGGSVYRLVTAN